MQPLSVGSTRARTGPTTKVRTVLALSLVALQAVDVVTTRMLLARGGREVNPVAGWLLRAGHLPAAKLGLASLIGVLILIAPLRRATEHIVWLVLGFYVVVLGFHLIELVAF